MKWSRLRNYGHLYTKLVCKDEVRGPKKRKKAEKTRKDMDGIE